MYKTLFLNLKSKDTGMDSFQDTGMDKTLFASLVTLGYINPETYSPNTNVYIAISEMPITTKSGIEAEYERGVYYNLWDFDGDLINAIWKSESKMCRAMQMNYKHKDGVVSLFCQMCDIKMVQIKPITEEVMFFCNSCKKNITIF